MRRDGAPDPRGSRPNSFRPDAILVRSPQSIRPPRAARRRAACRLSERGRDGPIPQAERFAVLASPLSVSRARFAEYLSLGQVPAPAAPALQDAPDGGSASRNPPYASSSDEVFDLPEEAQDLADDDDAAEGAPEGPEAAVVAGTLRAPWRWEKLLVDAAVIGQDAARWKRRLAGKAAELVAQAREAERQDGRESARVESLRQLQQQLVMRRTA